jgi:cysteine desulfurase
MVQGFGKVPIDINYLDVDSFSVSFHKVHGPLGVGMLGIKNSLIDNYDLSCFVAGSQNYKMRGGTENIPGIAGSFKACTEIFPNITQNVEKNKSCIDYLRSVLINKFGARYITQQLDFNSRCLILCDPESIMIPNTLYFTFVGKCNLKIRDFLMSKGIIIGIGSACEKGAPSHVAGALGLPTLVASGIIRISVNENTSPAHIAQFVHTLTH